MEMPISVIITLFVAVVVAMVVINFAVIQVGNAEEDVSKFDPGVPDQKDRVFELSTIDAKTIALTVKECMREFFGKSFNNEFCAIFRATTAYNLDAAEEDAIYTELAKYPELYESDGTQGVTEAEIKNYTVVNLANKNVFFIKWNGANTKVEVVGS